MNIRKAMLAAACLFAVLALPLSAADYAIREFNADIVVGRDAVLDINETVKAEFFRPLHGIFREIPIGYYNGKRAIVSDLSASGPFEIYDSGKNYIRLRFGEEAVVLTGPQEYALHYRYDVGADTNEGYDELYYNLVGEGWQVTLESCTFRIKFPSAVDSSSIWFTRGEYRSVSQDGVSWHMEGADTIVAQVASMRPGEELTVRVQLPDGYYAGAREIVNKTPLFFSLTAASCLAALGIAVVLWMRFGKDAVPVFYAESTPPEGMTPMQMGYLADGVVDSKDITSMLFYWADKGLLRISKQGKRKNSFAFTKLEDIGPEALEMERYLFDSFFDCGKTGADGVVVTEKNLAGFAEKAERTKLKIASYYKGERRLYDTKSNMAQGLCLLLGLFPLFFCAMTFTWDYPGALTIVLMGVGFVFLLVQYGFMSWLFGRWYVMKTSRGLAFAFACLPTVLMLVLVFIINDAAQSLALQMAGSLFTVLGLGALAFFCSIMTRRSPYAQKLLEQVLGYREFLDKVEMDKLKMMIEEDPEVYYHNLSYAIVLGLDDEWARKFSGMMMEPPEWYAGNDFALNALFYSSLARSWNDRFQVTAMPKSSSSRSTGMRFGGSSFGGSGFSGGGFGGGGGGAW